MPLRRWFSLHGMPGWYSWVILFLFTMASIGISVIVNAKLAERTIKQNQAAERKQGEQVRLATCLVIVTQDQVFNDPDAPPKTLAGKQAAAAWHSLRLQLRCDQQ